MYKVKVFKDMNLVLGILNGNFSKEELNTYGNDVVRNIENNLTASFTYVLDITNFGDNWYGANNEINEKMDEINHFLDLMGIAKTYIIGADRKVYEGYKKSKKLDKTIFFTNLDEAFAFIKLKVD